MLKFGNRIGRAGKLSPGASALIFERTTGKILLTRREDNGRWCLPGGGMDPGESAAEACVREVFEETGLQVKATKLVGIYTSPDILVEYPDGNKIQPVAFSFEVEITGGTLGLSDETTEVGYFTIKEMENMDMMEHHVQRIYDALESLPEAIYQ
ncbi:MAG: NUDIX domain-containing protein [Chloroflexota bacterium]|nr:NUDIX domain-containing protein [Chloroflexota bacterium]